MGSYFLCYRTGAGQDGIYTTPETHTTWHGHKQVRSVTQAGPGMAVTLVGIGVYIVYSI